MSDDFIMVAVQTEEGEPILCDGCTEEVTPCDDPDKMPVMFDVECDCGEGHGSGVAVYHQSCLPDDLKKMFSLHQQQMKAHLN